MIVRESWLMVDRVEDWSRVRSPGRARRRLRRGYPQNIIIRETPKKEAITIDGGRTYIMHPETAKEFRRLVVEQERTKPLPVMGAGLSPFFNQPMFALTGNS